MYRLSTWLLILIWLALGAVSAAAAVPEKPFPAGLVVPTLETALQRLSLYQPLSTMGGERVRVVVETSRYIPDADVAALGGAVTGRAPNMLEVEAPVSALVRLAHLPGVRFVRRPYRPVPLSVSAGAEVTGANAWHAAGIRGQGITVAVIDGGFEGLSAALITGALGNVVFTHDYTGEGLETGGVHGTACAEIVHEMAPDAQLLLMKIENEVDLANAVDDAITQGANVISHSMGWFNTNFYDGTGPIPGIARRAVNRGIIWVNSAGNSANGGHWEGNWSDVDGDGWLEFSGSDEVDDFELDAGKTVTLYLTWDAWPQTDQDYDLYLVDASGNVVAASEEWQTGTQAPSEQLSYTAPISGWYGVAIYAHSASTHPRLELFTIPYNLGLKYSLPASSIPAPANAAEVLTVGTIDWQDWSTGPQEEFSSQGPTNVSHLHLSSIVKPDICGPDGTAIPAYDGEFYGTSAAALYVAGAAALVWSAHPGWTAEEVRRYLEDNAVDLGVPGKDNVYGYGRVNLPAPSPASSGITHTYGAAAGWYMVSVPLASGAAADLFGTTAYTYDPAAGHYVAATNIEPAKGYWVYLPASKAVTDSGSQVTSDVTISMPVAGWYQISAPWSYPKSAIQVTKGTETKSWADAVSAGWVRDQIYTYKATDGAYTISTMLEPWYGYWVKANVDGLILHLLYGSEAVFPPPLSTVRAAIVPADLPPLPRGVVPSTSELRVLNMPNPIADESIVTFRVEGICSCLVEGMRVEVYDLAGRLVWSGSGNGAFIYWDTREWSLANGVYLYCAEVKVANKWEATPIGKLAILR